MTPLSLLLENYQSHERSVFDFTKLDKATLIVGENGAGKSSIFDAIEWVLFETSRIDKNSSLTTDEIVRDKQLFVQVTIIFTAKDGNTYKVIRKYTKSTRKMIVSLFIRQGAAWVQKGADAKTQTNKEIVRILGVGREVLVNSILCKQHEVAGIASKSSTDRLTLIKKLLDLGKFATLADNAKKKIATLETQLLQYATVLSKVDSTKVLKVEAEKQLTLTKQRSEVNVLQIQSQKIQIEKLRSQLDALNKVLGALEQLNKTLRDSQERVTRLLGDINQNVTLRERSEKKLADLRTEAQKHRTRFIEIENLKPDKTQLIAEYQIVSTAKDKIQTQVGSLSGMIEAVREQGKAIRAKLDNFKKLGVGFCPTCQNEVTTEHIHSVAEKYEHELTQLRERVVVLKAEHDTESEKLKTVNLQITELKQKEELFNRLIQEKNQLSERLKSLQEIGTATKESIDNQNKQIELDKAETVRLQKENELLNTKIQQSSGTNATAKHQSIVTQITDANKMLEQLNDQQGQFKVQTANATASLIEYNDILTTAVEATEKAAPIRADISILETLRVDFVKTIPTMILENCTTLLEEEANKCLRTLSDGFQVSIRTQHANVSNDNMKDVFDIIVTSSTGSRPFELLSGGEAFRVAFAIRIALSLVLTQEAGVRMGTIFYDEPFQDLDDKGLQKIQEVFVYLFDVFDHQLAITHASILKESFNDVVLVAKINDVSVITQKSVIPHT